LSRSAKVVRADFRGVLPTAAKNVAITFDDAFSSVGENAAPELASRSFPCAIFVPVGLLGMAPDWDVEERGSTYRELVMTREQLMAISSPLVTFGSHSLHHSHLSQLSKESIQTEVEASRDELQRLNGEAVRMLAFPYGESNSLVQQVCKEAGFEFLYTTVAENIDPSAPNMLRGRIRVDPWDGPVEFFLKFNGAYAWRSLLSDFLKSGR
jgi:peptidoglycan/xylan/chitin deacetylase (PgdA/CDA1 family)